MRIERIRDSIRGLILGDISGVPYEFKTAGTLAEIKFAFMDSTMTDRSHKQPIGTWSDDTGMTLAAMDGIKSTEVFPDNVPVAINFLSWYAASEYMPFGNVFDLGNTTGTSLKDLFLAAKKNNFWVTSKDGFREFVFSHDRWEKMTGDPNGSLMRILPHALYFSDIAKDEYKARMIVTEGILEASYITHPSMVCFLSCFLYTEIIAALLETESIDGIEIGRNRFLNVYKMLEDKFQNEWIKQVQLRGVGRWTPNLRHELRFLLMEDIMSQDVSVGFNETFSSVGALRLAIWALVNSSSFEEVIEKSIMAGGDTDTTAAIAGSMAGLIYPIPENWWEKVPRKEYLEEKIYEFSDTLKSGSLKTWA